jgi:hypothetical protein
MYLCVCNIDFASVSTIFRREFETVLTVWCLFICFVYFCFCFRYFPYFMVLSTGINQTCFQLKMKTNHNATCLKVIIALKYSDETKYIIKSYLINVRDNRKPKGQ